MPQQPVVPVVTVSPPEHPEYYSEIRLLETKALLRLDFIRAPGSAVPPPSVRALRLQIEDVARLVIILFQNDAAKMKDFFLQLHVAADSGLRGPDFSVEIGLENLQAVKNAISDAYPALRAPIWWWNLGLLGFVIAACAAASCFLHYKTCQSPPIVGMTCQWLPATGDGNSVWPTLELAAFLIPLGVVIGLFVEFLFRVNDDIPYEQLRGINPGRWKPVQRAINTIVVACIFAGLLGFQVFQVGIASVLLNDFIGTKPYLSLVIGFITGFAFPYVRDLVQQARPVKHEATT